MGQKRTPNGKTNAMDAPSIVRETFPKECVPSTGFGQRSFISETSFRQCGNVDIVSAELSGSEGSTSCRSISIFVIHKSSNVPGCKSEGLAGRCAKFSTAGKRCPMGAVTCSGSKERAMFRPPFLGPSSCEVSRWILNRAAQSLWKLPEGSAVPVPDSSDHHTRAACVQVPD